MNRPANTFAKQKAFSPARYFELVLAVGTILTCLNALRPFGGVVNPGWFTFLRWILHFQFGAFGCAVLTLLLYLLRRWRWPAFLRIPVFAAFFIWFLWVILWVLVRRAFGIELSADILWELFADRTAIAALGVGGVEFAVGIAVPLFIGAILGAVSDRISQRSNPKLLRVGCFIFCLAFALVHLPLRLLTRIHQVSNAQSIVAYHDYVPSLLHLERVKAGSHGERLTLPNLESSTRTAAYFAPSRAEQMPVVPQPRNIVWLNLESFRFDAIDESTMPRLSAYANRFQIRLNRQHWSGGNCTRFGVFSQLTGLSGYQTHNLDRAEMPDPFLSLLKKNGYRLRIAKRNQLKYAALLALLPPGTLQQEIEKAPHDREDRQMVDSYLQDRAARPAGTLSFDFIAFDATHWPYLFPPEHAVFQPAPPLNAAEMILGFRGDLAFVRNRYRNACHFIDEQIGRILNDLEGRKELASTIIVIVGDHGEEFQERGQMSHAAVLNDFQARTPLWMHLPERGTELLPIDGPTTHMDIVPTVLQALGFNEDVLYTQGTSLLSALGRRPILSLSDTGFRVPLCRTLVTATYISRWTHRPLQYLFAGVQRRDGAEVKGEEWISEVRALNSQAAEMYELLPDVSQPPRKFTLETRK
ncbi:MAG: sulfatase-like hydrolase/transferase [Spartobacteria bacterium]